MQLCLALFCCPALLNAREVPGSILRREHNLFLDCLIDGYYTEHHG